MKILFVTLLAVSSLFNTKASANDIKVNHVVLESFYKVFTSATEVTWSLTEEVYKAQFTFKGQHISAYFDGDGRMIAAGRHISSLQLPISLQTSLKKDHGDYWISELFEVSNEVGTTYYITLEDADTKVILRSIGTSGWSNYQKQHKS